MKVGFIGLGIMGSRMARNLLSAGHDVTVYNRSPQNAEALIAGGAKWAKQPAELAQGVEVLFTMLSTPDAVQSMAVDADGFLEALPGGALWVDCSTVNPGFSRWMAVEARSCDIRFLDAPVAGSKGPAETAELVFLVGGDKNDLALCRPLLECMGKRIIHVGPTGQGAAMKMLFNLMLGSAMAAYSEALVLGQSLGIDKDTIGEVILNGPVAAPFLALKQALIEAMDFEAHFPLRWMHKDLHLAAQTAYETGVALPALNTIKEVYALAEKCGYGEDDFAAVYRFLADG